MDDEQFVAQIIITNHFKQLPVHPEIVYANRNFLNLVGCTLDEIINQNPAKVFAGWNSDQFITEIVDSVEHQRPWSGTLNIKKKDGEITKQFIVTPVHNITNEISYYSCITVLDPTELAPKKGKNQQCLDTFVTSLWQFSKHFKEMCEMAPASLLKIDLNGDITYVNVQANQHYGLKVGDNFFNLCSNKNNIKSIFQSSGAVGQVVSRDFNLTVNNNCWTITCKFWPITNDNNQITGYSTYLIDVTKKREVARQLMALKGI